MPFERPLTTIGDDVPVFTKLPGVEIALYCVIVEPPSELGGENEIEALVLPGTAIPITGAVGTTAFAV